MALLKNVYGTSEGKNNFRVEVNHITLVGNLFYSDIIVAQAQPVQNIPLRAGPLWQTYRCTDSKLIHDP